MTTVDFPLIPGKAPSRFRFTIPTTRQLELAAGVGIDTLRFRGQTVWALVLLTCYALKWADPKMSEERAGALVQGYLDGGGKIKDLTEALVKALNESGVYGEVEKPAAAEEDGAEDPTTATATQTT